MRYRDGEMPDVAPYGVTDEWLMFTVGLALVIGITLVWLGIRGRQWWLVTWCAGLVVVSLAYFIWPDWPY